MHLLIVVQGTAGDDAGPQICNLLISSVVKKGVGASVGVRANMMRKTGNYLADTAGEKLIGLVMRTQESSRQNCQQRNASELPHSIRS